MADRKTPLEKRHAYLNADLRVIKAILAGKPVPEKVRRKFGYHRGRDRKDEK